MIKNRCVELVKLGQSPWLDYISRDMIRSGELKRMIDKGIIYGVTSNPTIFEKSISTSEDYNGDIEHLTSEGKDAGQIYDALTIKDVTDAADLFRELFKKTNGRDGYVSLEVSPKYAHHTDSTIKDVKRLSEAVNRPNVMFKVPATQEGIPAIRTLLAEGININATLIFSIAQYERIAHAYIDGLRELDEKGGRLADVASVASVFVSRIDTACDKRLDELGILDYLKGKPAVANAKCIYERFREIFSIRDFRVLKNKGARIQRLLWGSTGTKNPAYSDVKYVEELIGKDTVNTMPQNTLSAFLDHGVCKITLTEGFDEVRKVIDELSLRGINLNDVCEQLQADGVAAFADSFNNLIHLINNKMLKDVSFNA